MLTLPQRNSAFAWQLPTARPATISQPQLQLRHRAQENSCSLHASTTSSPRRCSPSSWSTAVEVDVGGSNAVRVGSEVRQDFADVEVVHRIVHWRCISIRIETRFNSDDGCTYCAPCMRIPAPYYPAWMVVHHGGSLVAVLGSGKRVTRWCTGLPYFEVCRKYIMQPYGLAATVERYY
jgi:hypothetical protein